MLLLLEIRNSLIHSLLELLEEIGTLS